MATEAPPPKRSVLRRLGKIVDSSLTFFFAGIARVVSNHPYTTLLLALLAGFIMAGGIARIEVVTTAEDLYTPQGTDGFKDRDYVESLYGYGQVYNYIYTTAKDRNGSNVLSQEALLAQLDVWEKLLDVEGTFKGSYFNLSDSRVCFRPGGSGTPCDVVTILDFWNYSRSAILADSNLGSTVSNPNATDALGRTISSAQVMGGVTRDANGIITKVLAFQASIVLQNNKNGKGSDKIDDITTNWQKAAVPFIRKYETSSIDLFINSEWAQNDVSDKAITGDISLLAVGYGLLFAYGLVILSKGHPVFSQAQMTVANIGSIGLAVLGSYGLCIVCGLPFSLVVQVLALLLLGLGTDDMLVTMAAHEEILRELPPDASVVDVIVATVSRARRGVIVAAMTNFVALCTGTQSSLPALRDFCIFAAVGVILVLIFQSCFFVACLTLDVRRQRAQKRDLLCCFTSSAGPTDGCCGRTYHPDKPKASQVIIGHWLPKVILNPVGKVAVLAITIFLFVMGVIGASKVVQNFDNDWFIPDGSWVKTVLKVRDQYFSEFSGKGAIPFSVYTKNIPSGGTYLDYYQYQDELLALGENLKTNKYVSSAPAVRSWYSSYIEWIPGSSYSSNLTNGRPSTSAVFYASLAEFLAQDGKRFKENLIFSNTTANVILSSKIDAYFITLSDSVQQVNAMKSVRKSAEESAPSLSAIAYTFPFLFYEGFEVIAWDTAKEVIIAGASVFVILLLMLADLTAAITVGAMVCFIDVELIGFLHWAGLSFNSVTSINLLLAIGIAVDYSAFTAFSFMTRTGTRQERAEKALANFGVAVFNGGLTLWLAVLPAAFAQSFIFQTFFKMFSMIVLLGLWHGLCALPVLLSLIGAEAYDSAYEREAEANLLKGETHEVAELSNMEAPTDEQMK